MTDEIGWLCELPSTAFGPSWWCAPEHEWTKDASKALRFARKQDAENYIAEIGEWTDVIATEHMWAAKRTDGYGDPAKGEYNAFLADDGGDIPCD